MFTVCRLLSQWKQQGIVSTPREGVVVHNLEALEELSESLSPRKPSRSELQAHPCNSSAARAILCARRTSPHASEKVTTSSQ
jgi:hypothetical protein